MRFCFVKHGEVTLEWKSLKSGNVGDFPDGLVPYIQEFAGIAGQEPALVLAIGSTDLELVDGNVRVVTIRGLGQRGIKFWFDHFRGLWRMWRELVRFRPDLSIVLTPDLKICVAWVYHTWHGGQVLPALAGTPLPQSPGRFARIVGNLVLRTLNSPRVPVVLSRGCAPGRMVREKLGDHKEIWEFWPQYPRAQVESREEVELSQDGRFRVFFVGRIIREKGIFEVLEMAMSLRKEIPSLHVVVIGDGPDRQEAEQRCRELNLEGVVTFLGHKPAKMLFSYFATGEVLVVPTHASFPEGTCKACIEGVLGGLIPVASSVGGLVDNVDDGVTGYLVPASRTDLFVERILHLYRNPELRAQMRNNAEKKRQFFLNPPNTLPTCVRRFVEHYCGVGT